ncbi:hypothetical protein ABZ136_03655 [Streptomyces microflavus]
MNSRYTQGNHDRYGQEEHGDKEHAEHIQTFCSISPAELTE